MKTLEQIMKEKAANALVEYAAGEDKFNSGWDVLRYAKQGMYRVKQDCSDVALNMATEWYPRNMDFVILRFAKNDYYEMKM
jgi:hypothetical protein